MKTFTGTVVRSSTPKTAFVQVASYWMHPVLKKKKKVTSVFVCHDTVGVQAGEAVVIGEIRPMSKTKRFKIVEKVSEK